MNLRAKLFDIFGVIIPEGTSDKAALKELDRRGKIDLPKLLAVIFVLIAELEALKENKK